ncbi:lytic transglycosylase domain-containing protein [Nocardioides panacisoli]|uniref:aggregation-promoting factor C-terminal-like domain-containing protein n=1 Tax=Nocardioides panacisoli TaxID=627624 RepID=UPI001C62F7FF|nr:transglycosylase SLT domain-containing protein [Nocardioides panacisoli]QYJ02656.1 lytic transglycosylase domain-containing protein [Nocardioides panacisoli]
MSSAPHRSSHGARRRAAKPARPAWLAKAGLGAAAALITGSAVGVGVLGQPGAGSVSGDLGAVVDLQAVETTPDVERQAVVSRSDRREPADPEKSARLDPGKPQAETRTESLEGSDPRTIARALMGDFGFSASQFGCLDSLWQKESGWNPAARNPSSGAHGIPQALPGSKMASAGSDWATNPRTQITWGLGYIQDRYGSPCAAWGHSQRVNWY